MSAAKTIPFPEAPSHYELVACPECKERSVAQVIDTTPFAIYVHDCPACKHTITESEWNAIVKDVPYDLNSSAALPIGLSKPFTEVVPVSEVLRSLTWNEPYATLMLHGKQETRTRATNVRSWVLICAAKKMYDTGTIRFISGGTQVWRINECLQNEDIAKTCGHAIAIGYLHDCTPMKITDEDATFVEFDHNFPRYVWHFKHVYRIKPIPWRGKQGWGIVDNFFERQRIIIL